MTIIALSLKKKAFNFADTRLFKEMHCKMEQLAVSVSNLNDLVQVWPGLGCAKEKFEVNRNLSHDDSSLCGHSRRLACFHPYDFLVAMFA